MSAAFIIDSSITMAWCFLDEQTPSTAHIRDRLNGEIAQAPALWMLEVTNVLALAERRGRITPKLSTEFLSTLRRMNIEIDHESAERAFEHVLPLCRQHNLTASDATYLELALRTALPIATLDNDLRIAATKVGVSLLGT
jgi:predicted nucleic acid-binding protein